jgi:hypothetical protein
MSIHFYRDLNGYVGEPREPDQTPREAADQAQAGMLAAAENLAALCDRHDGDSGEDADLIDALTREIDALADRVRAALGEPRVKTAQGLLASVEIAYRTDAYMLIGSDMGANGYALGRPLAYGDRVAAVKVAGKPVSYRISDGMVWPLLDDGVRAGSVLVEIVRAGR